MATDTYRQRAWDTAMGQYGYVTTDDARELGIPVVELGKLAGRDRIRHVAYGLYRFDDFPTSRFDQFFEAVARVGDGAHLTGDAVLALHNLALVNPRRIRVGTPRRARAKLPDWIEVVNETIDPADLTRYELIPSTTVAYAIRTCRDSVMTDRLLTAVHDARRDGLVTATEARTLHTELSITR